VSDFLGFRPAAQRFFRTLARHNTRDWFEANRALYEHEVREPMRSLVEELDVRLATLAPELMGDPRRSVFRIHRDIRFSKDKSPYKTNAGCWFYHRNAGRAVGQDAEGGGAGFYFHLDGSSSFVAGGIWMPPRGALNRIRDAIAEAPAAVPALLLEPRFKRRFGALSREAMLTRVPRGYPPDHPAAELLRFQSFTVSRKLSAKEIGTPRLVDRLAREFEVMLPLVRWLNRALGHLPADSRL